MSEIIIDVFAVHRLYPQRKKSLKAKIERKEWLKLNKVGNTKIQLYGHNA